MEPLAIDIGDALLDSGIVESDLEDELLAAFYAFTYDDAVLVGATGSPPKLSGKDSPLRRPPSPSKQDPPNTGPTASHVTGAAADEPVISREMLDGLIPPKTWRDESGKRQRVVRSTASSRTDVVRFETLLTRLLHDHQARASAICPVREKFFLQVFEELIRQCACECPARGLLLLRLRDQLRMTVQSYQTLYHSSIAYGRHKAVQADAGMAELEDRIRELQQEQQKLHARRQQLMYRLELTETETLEKQHKRAHAQRQHVRFLRDQHTQLEAFHTELTQATAWK